MNILAFDTATEYLTVALKTDPGLYTIHHHIGFKHAEYLMRSVDHLLGLKSLSMKEIDLVVCTRGPGSFTGLRIGMATAKGLAAPLSIPLVSVPTLCLYAQDTPFTTDLLASVLDARKKRYYISLFDRQGEVATELDVSSQELIERYLKDRSLTLTGYDAPRLASELSSVSQKICIDPFYDRSRASALCDMGSDLFQNQGPDAADAGPVYLRKSEAELAREARS